MQNKRKFALFWLISTIFIFLSVELVGQILASYLNLPFPTANDAALVEPDFYLGYEFKKNAKTNLEPKLEINELGFRGPAPVLGKTNSTLFVGDSVTMGRSIPVEKTFPILLNGFNAGVDGYGTHQEYLKLKRDLKAYKFEEVVLVVCANDVEYRTTSKYWIKHIYVKNLFEAQNFFLFYSGWARIYLWKKGIIKQQLAANSRLDRLQDRTATDPAGDGWYWAIVSSRLLDQALLSDWTDQILSIKNVFPESKFTVVVIPPRIQAKKFAAGERDFMLDDKLNEVLKESGVRFISPVQILAEYPIQDIYLDKVHLTQKGHKVLARHLKNILYIDQTQ